MWLELVTGSRTSTVSWITKSSPERIVATQKGARRIRHVCRCQRGIPNYGERWRNEESIATGFVESAVNQIVSKRFAKKQQMQWTKKSAHLVLQMRTQVLDERLEDTFRDWYPDFRRKPPENEIKPGGLGTHFFMLSKMPDVGSGHRRRESALARYFTICADDEMTISGRPLYSSIFPVTVIGLPLRDSRNFCPPTAATLSDGTNPVKTCRGYLPPKLRKALPFWEKLTCSTRPRTLAFSPM
jgi:hypothetical protein